MQKSNYNWKKMSKIVIMLEDNQFFNNIQLGLQIYYNE